MLPESLPAFKTLPTLYQIPKPFISYALATNNKLATNALVCASADKGVCQNADTTSKFSSFSSQYGCVKWGMFVDLGLNPSLQLKQRLLPTTFAVAPHS
jgi:hypothetical protein